CNRSSTRRRGCTSTDPAPGDRTRQTHSWPTTAAGAIRGSERVSSIAIACTNEQANLGEGARWDDRYAELQHVDIVAARVLRDRVPDGGAFVSVRSYQLPDPVGAIAPVAADGGWLVATGRGFVHLTIDGDIRSIASVTPAGTRMNDAACDPRGRFWAG